VGVIMDALNRRSPAEAAQYVLDHMASMVEPIQVIALRHVVERLLAEQEYDTLVAERDRLQRDRDNLTIMFNDEVRWRNAESSRAEALRTQLMQAERVVEAARAMVGSLVGAKHLYSALVADVIAAVDALDGTAGPDKEN